MTAELKALIRRQLVSELIELDLKQEQLEEYIQTDLSKTPKEWLKDNGGEIPDAAMEEYLNSEFPKAEDQP